MKVLIIGTSHSEASCRRHKDDKNVERMMQGRYHDYFKTELGWDTTVIAQGGVTPQAQLWAVTAYLADHPNETWDLCLFEGRNVEATVTIPSTLNPDQPAPTEWKDIYHRFVDKDDYENEFETPFYCLTTDTEKMWKSGPFYRFSSWANEYVLTYNQMLDFFGCNRAIISMVEQRCPIVKFWIYSHPLELLFGDPRYNPEYKYVHDYGEQILGDYWLLDNPWSNVNVPNNMRCACNHANEEGHKWLWDNVIKPATLKLIDK
jgi:hypothetical protein